MKHLLSAYGIAGLAAYFGLLEIGRPKAGETVAAGKLKVQEDIIDGLENTPRALIGLLAGENRGKRMVRV